MAYALLVLWRVGQGEGMGETGQAPCHYWCTGELLPHGVMPCMGQLQSLT